MRQSKIKYIKAFLSGVLIIIAGFCYSCGRQGQELKPLTAAETGSVKEAAEPEPEPPAVCYVHICGEVNSPGVYEMEPGQRLYQVVERAGGYTQEAARDYLNLAETVSDGMKLAVPGRQELLEGNAGQYGTDISGPGESAPEKINLNTASKEMLMSLRGIGEARAEDIIRYREAHGSFRSIEEIMNVSGIKNAAFEKIKDDITV